MANKISNDDHVSVGRCILTRTDMETHTIKQIDQQMHTSMHACVCSLYPTELRTVAAVGAGAIGNSPKSIHIRLNID